MSPPVDPRAGAVAGLRAGEAVVLIDETGGVVAFAAETATPELVAFAVRHTEGFLRVAITDGDAARMDLPPMWVGSADTVAVDASACLSTGISARDRACAIRALASAGSGPADFTRPGHVVPTRARGRTADLTELAVSAGLRPAVVMSALSGRAVPTRLAGPDEAAEFAARYHLRLLPFAGVTKLGVAAGPNRRPLPESAEPTPAGGP